MARAQMGLIVTKLAGKLNGHCFRNSGNSQILEKLSSTNNVNELSRNKSLPAITKVLKNWRNVSVEERVLWSEIATANPVLDRWGNSKTLTNRQFYIKVQIQRLLTFTTFLEASNFSPLIPNIAISSILISEGEEEFSLSGGFFDEDSVIAYCVKEVPYFGYYVNPKKATVSTYLTVEGYNSNVLFQQLEASGLMFTVGKIFHSTIFAISPSGLKSAKLTFYSQVVG